MPPQQPLPPHPVAPPAPRKPKLSQEQKIIRAAAIVGSLITFLGASFGIALAIQSGLLGPVGRAIGAFIFGLTLLGIGIWVDTRRSPSAGVTALYVTSLLVIFADLSYITWVEEWISHVALGAFFLVLWILYLALAAARKNLGLVLCMCLAMLFYHFSLDPLDVTQTAISMVAPLLALAVTWYLRSVGKNLNATVRAVTAAVLVWQTYWASYFLQDDPTNFLALIPLSGAALLIASELFFPDAALAQAQVPPILNGIIMPTLVVWMCFGITSDWGMWLPIATASIICVCVSVTRRSAEALVNGWLIITPLTFLAAPVGAPQETLAFNHKIYTIVFIAAFIGTFILLRFRAAHQSTILFVWVLVLFLMVLDLFAIALGGYESTELGTFHLVHALALAVLLTVAASQVKLWRTMDTGARNTLAGIGLFFATVSWVSITTIIGDFISPRPNPSDRAVFTEDRYALTGADIGFLIGHMSVSIVLMALASWLLLKRPGSASSPSSKSTRTAGLILAVVATGKLVFFDMASLSGIPRVLAFTISGLLLIAVAVLGAQRNGTRNGTRPQPAAGTPGPVEDPGPGSAQPVPLPHVDAAQTPNQ
nr:Predicted membrane protein [Streptococcus thermophilus]